MSNQSKVALITGARGIGKEVALGLAKEGYRICLLSRSQASLQKAASELGQLSLEPLLYECDTGDVDAVNQAVEAIIKQCGHIDVLFNGAGVLHDGTLENVDTFNSMIRVNLVGAFNVLQAVVPHMKKRKQGYIFNVASLCGKVGYPGIGAYTASKFGLVGLSESLFHELAPHNINVTAICPSFVATDMVAHLEYPPKNLMIRPGDLFQIIRTLLLLSPQACVKELVIYCRATLSA